MPSKLTVTEAETLAVLLNSAMRRMATASDGVGNYAWPSTLMREASEDMCTGFIQLAPLQVHL